MGEIFPLSGLILSRKILLPFCEHWAVARPVRMEDSRRYEDRKAEQAKQKRKEIENEVNTLLEKQNNLQECHNKNVEYVNNWANQAVEKIKKANAKIAEYEECVNDMERKFLAELEEAVLQTLGDIPEPPEIDFEAPTANFSTYDEEEYEL